MINSSSYRTYYIQTVSTRMETNSPADSVKYWQLMLLIAKNNWLKYLLHACIWLCLYFLPVILLTAIKAINIFPFLKPGNPAYLLSYILVIVFSYLNHYWLVPAFFIPKKRFSYFLLAAAFIAVIAGLQSFADVALSVEPTAVTVLNYTFILSVISVFASIIFHLENGIAAAKKEISKMKIISLTNQINPHFLFNSLNWIYLLAVTESNETPGAIIQLSGMMRHVMQASTVDFIDLKKELAYIKDYVWLQKARLGNTVTLHCSLPVYKEAGKIAPLLLMSFIENAFKHGINPDEDSVINIDIAVGNNKIDAEIINNKVSPAEKNNSNGVGISNAQQRLHMLYPSMHHLEIIENSKIYSVKLSMQLL